MNKLAYINGEFVDSAKKVEIISPLTLEVCGSVPGLMTNQIDLAFNSARAAFKGWRALPLEERIKYINKFCELLAIQREKVAQIMKQEIGKSINESLTEINRSIEYIKDTIETWNEIKVKTVKTGKKISHQVRVPLGVVLAISPFNYPVNLSLVKIVPALLAGNTVVFKAATNGSLTAGHLTEVFAKANFPKGTFNFVSGRGREIGDSLITNKNIDMVTFTGGVRVGKDISEKVTMKPLILELGGNDAGYIRHDTNLEQALNEVVAGAFGFAGQRCTAIKRLILHKDIAEGFIEKLLQKLNTLKVDKVIGLSSAKYLKELFEDSIKRGDQILKQGTFEKNKIDPILIKTDSSSRIWNEEQFGPILPLVIVEGDEEAIKIMNASEFGLQNSIFTSDIKWALEVSKHIESGTVNINRKSSRGPDNFPFSGIKNSGFGTQGVAYALESMTRILNIVENEV